MVAQTATSMVYMLALPAVPGSESYGGPSVVSPNASLIRLVKEQAGHGFYKRYEEAIYLSMKGSEKDADKEADKDDKKGSQEETGTTEGGKKKNFKHNSSINSRVKKALEDDSDLFGYLCCPVGAGQDEIKKMYRMLCLVFHPDKKNVKQTPRSPSGAKLNSFPSSSSVAQDDNSSERAEREYPWPDPTTMTEAERDAHFLKIQNAFEILSDPVLARQYESHLPFDDFLPNEQQINAAEDYYTYCDKYFQKEAKWSEEKPVPRIGDANTPLDQVKKFYRWWANFRSWRDFSNAGEYDLDEASDRDEKRWMQRENWKVVSKLVKDERVRLIRFVTAAENTDPRLLAEQQAIYEERNKVKWERQRAKAEAERKAKEAEEAAQAAALKAKEDAAKAKVATKRRLQEMRKRIRQPYRAYCEGNQSVVREFTTEDMMEFTLNANEPLLIQNGNEITDFIASKPQPIDTNDAELVNQIGDFVSKSIRHFMSEWNAIRTGTKKLITPVPPSPIALESAAEEPKAEEPQAEEPKAEEPKGEATTAEATTAGEPTTETAADTPAGTASGTASGGASEKVETAPAETPAAASGGKQWTLEELSVLAKALNQFPGGTPERWEKIAAFVKASTHSTVEIPVKEVIAQAKKLGTVKSGQDIRRQVNDHAAEELRRRIPAGKTTNIAAPPDVRDSSTITSWTSTQQNALESALAKYPTTMPPQERWKAIAGEVEGKSAKECLARFKEIREAILAKTKVAELLASKE